MVLVIDSDQGDKKTQGNITGKPGKAAGAEEKQKTVLQQYDGFSGKILL
jgi:hypothetical protein